MDTTATVKALTDAEHTALVLVAHAQPGALGEAARAVAELADIGIDGTHLAINAAMPDTETSEPLAVAIRAREQHAIADIPPVLRTLVTIQIPLNPANMVGVPALRSLLATAGGQPVSTNYTTATGDTAATWPGLSALVDELSQANHGLVMCMGKGGVGKATVAAQSDTRIVVMDTAPTGHTILLMDATGLLAMRAAAEPPLIQRVAQQTSHLAVVPMLAQELATQPLSAFGDEPR